MQQRTKQLGAGRGCLPLNWFPDGVRATCVKRIDHPSKPLPAAEVSTWHPLAYLCSLSQQCSDGKVWHWQPAGSAQHTTHGAAQLRHCNRLWCGSVVDAAVAGLADCVNDEVNQVVSVDPADPLLAGAQGATCTVRERRRDGERLRVSEERGRVSGRERGRERGGETYKKRDDYNCRQALPTSLYCHQQQTETGPNPLAVQCNIMYY